MTWLERICAVHERSERPAVIGDEGSVSGGITDRQGAVGRGDAFDQGVDDALARCDAVALQLCRANNVTNRPLLWLRSFGELA